MDKRAILKESITKLLQLGISDKEIIDNLRGVGIESETARAMLAETKKEISTPYQVPLQPSQPSQRVQPQSQMQKQQKKSGQMPKTPEQEQEDSGLILPDDEDIYAKAQGQDELPARQVSAPQQKEQRFVPSYVHEGHIDTNVETLWEKGVLATVDAKLNEMKKIKSDLDNVIEQRIAEKFVLESRKIETVLESQRSLFYAKIDAHLDAKAGELKDVLEARSRQSEDLNAKVQNSLQRLQGENKFNAELFNTLNDKLSGLDTVKSQVISEANRSIISMESRFGEFMGDAENRRDQYEGKLNSALELHSKITEGLEEDMKQKIDAMRFEKEQELDQRIKGKIVELDKYISEVDTKGIAEKIARMKELDSQITSRQKELDVQFVKSGDALRKYTDSYLSDLHKDFNAYKKEVSKIQTDNLSELKKEYAANVDELFSENLVEWDKKLKEKKKEIDELKSKVDIEKFDASMESLDLFKQQFLNTVKRSIEDYNKSKKELAESMITRDKSITDHLKRIDEKMKELSEFEKKFSSDVGGLLEELQAARKLKQENKPLSRKPRPDE